MNDRPSPKEAGWLYTQRTWHAIASIVFVAAYVFVSVAVIQLIGAGYWWLLFLGFFIGGMLALALVEWADLDKAIEQLENELEDEDGN